MVYGLKFLDSRVARGARLSHIDRFVQRFYDFIGTRAECELWCECHAYVLAWLDP